MEADDGDEGRWLMTDDVDHGDDDYAEGEKRCS